jgi:glutamate-5-semialdehyde dehydrogenase
MLATLCADLRNASKHLAAQNAAQRNRALAGVAQEIERAAPEILAANARDVDAAEKAGMTGPLVDRLSLSPERLAAVASSLATVIALPDPLGQVVSG